MAVGKGSMARASRAAGKKVQSDSMEAAIVENAESGQEKEIVKTAKKVVRSSGAKSGAKTVKKTADKKETAGRVIEAASEEVLQHIVYQKSSQVLDRKAEDNETFGIGEAMPIYFF